MKRWLHSAALVLLVGAAPPSTPASSTQLPDVVGAGRTAATLSDWQTIAFFLMFLLVVSTAERLISGWQSRSTAAKLADAIDRLAQATESRATDIKVTLALIQQQLGMPHK